MNLGFFPAGLVFGAMILVPLAGWRLGWLNPIVGLGDGTVSALGIAAFALCVLYVARSGRDIQRPALMRPEPATGQSTA